jgi:hypothetical protein
MLGFKNKNKESGGTSRGTYLDPLVPLFLPFFTLKASHVRKKRTAIRNRLTGCAPE